LEPVSRTLTKSPLPRQRLTALFVVALYRIVKKSLALAVFISTKAPRILVVRRTSAKHKIFSSSKQEAHP